MRLLKLLVLSIFVICVTDNIIAQDQQPMCDSDEIFCDIQGELSGTQFSMFTEDDVTLGPNPLCDNSGFPHNTSWFGFVAGTESLTLQLQLVNCDPGDCNGGTDNCWGVQIAAYESCDLDNNVFCDVNDCAPGDAIQDPVTLLYSHVRTYTLNDLNVGDDYFILLDGCGGSACDYTVIITGTSAAFTPEFGGPFIDCDNCDDIDDLCPGSEVDLISFDENGDQYDLSITYNWSIEVPAGNTFNFQEEGNLELNYTFDEAGDYTICVEAETVCDTNDEVCRTITISEVDDEDFGIVEICEEILDDGLDQNDINDATAVGTTDEIGNIDLNGDGESGIQGNYDIFNEGVQTSSVMDSRGCVWEETFEVVQIDTDAPIDVVAYFCQGGSVSLTENNSGTPILINETEDESEFDYTAFNGCEAMYIVTAWELIVESFTLSQGDCGTDGVSVIFDPTSVELEDVDIDEFFLEGGTVTWVWALNGVPITGSENLPSWVVPFGDNGQYSVIITLEIVDPFTGSTISCDNPNLANSNFIVTDPALSQPLVTVPDMLTFCPEDSMVALITLDIFGFDPTSPDTQITWTVPGDVTVVSGGAINDNTILLDYSNTLDNTVSNTVMFSVQGTCGQPFDGDVEINFAPTAEPILDLTGLECPGETFTVTASGLPPVADLDTIIWTFGNGTIITGDTTTVTTGPLEIMWPDNDQKIVIVEVSYVDGCNNYESRDTINFILDPTPPVVSCFSNQNTITYEWLPITDATEYIVTLPDGSTETVTETMYIIGGLQENECRDISVEAINNSGSSIFCQSLSGASDPGNCCTKECPLTTAMINNPYNETICLDLNDVTAVFSATFSEAAAAGIHNWGGPGIDPATGLFDPVAAGIGTHTITHFYEFTDTDIAGCRTPTETTMVTITQLPTFNMSVSESIVCVGDQVTISFDGTYDPASDTNLFTNGGTIVDDSDLQNIIVSWDTPGPKTISSFIEADGCGNVLTTDIPVTVEDLPALNVTCTMQSSSSVTFEWTTDPGYDNYTVVIDSDPPFDTNDGIAVINGLAENTTVNIVVTGNSGNSCPSMPDSESCTSVNCPAVTLIPSIVGVENICLDGTETPFTITGTPDDPSLLISPDPVEISVNGSSLAGGLFDPTAFGPGTFDVSLLLRDDNCTFPASFQIVIEDVPTLSLDADTRICIDQSWSVDYTGDVNGAFTYSWASTDGQTFTGTSNQVLDFDIPGNYILDINASTVNCTAVQATAMVEVIDSLTTPMISCQEDIGEVLFTWVDGNDECENSYSISINGTIVDNIDDIEYLVDGLTPDTDVTITVINESDDCICDNKQNSFTCRTLPCPSVTISLPYDENTICKDPGIGNFPDEVFDISSQDDLTDYTITYESIPPVTFNGNAVDINALPEGTYTITATATNGLCVEQDVAVLTIVEFPDLQFNFLDEICIEEDLEVTYIGGDLVNATFEWTGMGTAGFADQLNPTISFDQPGTFTYTFVVEEGECDGDEPITVTVLDSLRTPTVSCNPSLNQIELTIGAEQTNCDGTLELLVDGVPFTGDISSGTVLLDNLTADTSYDIEVLNTSDCRCADKMIQTTCSTNDCPDFNFSSTEQSTLTSVTFSWQLDEPECGGSTSVLVDGVAFTGDISGNSITIDQLDAEQSVSFEVIYTSNCNCDFAQTETVMTEMCPEPNLVTTWEGTLTSVDYSWTFDEPSCGGTTMITVDGVPFTGDISSNMITIDQLPAGESFDVEIVYTSNCGCNFDLTETVSTNACPDLNFNANCTTTFDSVTFTWTFDEPNCPGQLTAMVDGQPFTGDISSGEILLEDLSADTQVDFDLIYTSDCGCNGMFEMMCQTDPCPDVNLTLTNTASQFCLDAGTTITHQLDASANGTTLGTADVVWSGLGIDANGMITLDANTTPSGEQTYVVMYELAGCMYEEMTTLNLIAPPSFDLELIEPCPGEQIAILNILNADTDPSIVYTLDGTIITDLSNISVGDGPNLVEAVAFGECMFSDSRPFAADAAVELSIEGDTLSFAGVENVYTLNTNTTFDQVIWDINGESFTGNPATIAYFDPGRLCATGLIGDCEYEVCAMVDVNTENVFIPNVFDPSANEPNNRLQVLSNVEIAQLASFQVFDRWGNKVFNAENVNPEDESGQWDGSGNGEPLEQGVYIYMIEVEFLSGEIRQVIGDITLIR